MSAFLFGLYKFVKYAVLPYTWLILFFGLVFVLSLGMVTPRRLRAIRILAIAGILVGWGLGNGLVASSLISILESQYPPLVQPLSRTYDAIVVLGGGVRSAGALRPDTELAWVSMERTICGVELFTDGLAPRLVFAGGDATIFGYGSVEAEEMKRLAVRLGVPGEAILVEGVSRNTYENAVGTKQLLGQASILLVTSASHIPRALGVFKKQGLEATPAPCGYLAQNGLGREWGGGPFALLPDVRDFHTSTDAIVEFVGSLVYWMAGKL